MSQHTVTLWYAWQHTKISQKAKLLVLTVEPIHSAWLTGSEPSLPRLWHFESLLSLTALYEVDVEIKKNFILNVILYSLELKLFQRGSG